MAGYLLAAASRGARGRPGLGDPRETGGEIDTDVLSDDIAAVAMVRPLLRALAWAGSLVAMPGVAGLILTIQYFAGDLSNDRLGGIHPGIYLFVYACFLVLGLAFGLTAWLTRR